MLITFWGYSFALVSILAISILGYSFVIRKFAFNNIENSKWPSVGISLLVINCFLQIFLELHLETITAQTILILVGLILFFLFLFTFKFKPLKITKTSIALYLPLMIWFIIRVFDAFIIKNETKFLASYLITARDLVFKGSLFGFNTYFFESYYAYLIKITRHYFSADLNLVDILWISQLSAQLFHFFCGKILFILVASSLVPYKRIKIEKHWVFLLLWIVVAYRDAVYANISWAMGVYCLSLVFCAQQVFLRVGRKSIPLIIVLSILLVSFGYTILQSIPVFSFQAFFKDSTVWLRALFLLLLFVVYSQKFSEKLKLFIFYALLLIVVRYPVHIIWQQSSLWFKPVSVVAESFISNYKLKLLISNSFKIFDKIGWSKDLGFYNVITDNVLFEKDTDLKKLLMNQQNPKGKLKVLCDHDFAAIVLGEGLSEAYLNGLKIFLNLNSDTLIYDFGDHLLFDLRQICTRHFL